MKKLNVILLAILANIPFIWIENIAYKIQHAAYIQKMAALYPMGWNDPEKLPIDLTLVWILSAVVIGLTFSFWCLRARHLQPSLKNGAIFGALIVLVNIPLSFAAGYYAGLREFAALAGGTGYFGPAIGMVHTYTEPSFLLSLALIILSSAGIGWLLSRKPGTNLQHSWKREGVVAIIYILLIIFAAPSVSYAIQQEQIIAKYGLDPWIAIKTLPTQNFNYGISKNDKYVYSQCGIVKGGDPKNLLNLYGPYFDYQNAVYVVIDGCLKRIDGADAATFVGLNGLYAKDKNQAYYYGFHFVHILRDADVATFSVLAEHDYQVANNSHAKDALHYYLDGVIDPRIDATTVVYLGPAMVQDKNGKWQVQGDKLVKYESN